MGVIEVNSDMCEGRVIGAWQRAVATTTVDDRAGERWLFHLALATDWEEAVGSEIYASLLNGLLVDYLAGGVTAEILEGLSDRPLNDAIALRLLAAACETTDDAVPLAMPRPLGPIVLYRTLGPTLPAGLQSAAALWALLIAPWLFVAWKRLNRQPQGLAE